jgi:hypothetical protein
MYKAQSRMKHEFTETNSLCGSSDVNNLIKRDPVSISTSTDRPGLTFENPFKIS